MTTKVYKVLTRVRDGHKWVLASQYPDLPFSMPYPVGEIVRTITGTPLLAYSHVPFYVGTSFSLEVWEAEAIGSVTSVNYLIDTASIQRLTVEQLIEQWYNIRNNGEPNSTVKMEAPRGTVAVRGLRLLRKMPKFPKSAKTKYLTNRG